MISETIAYFENQIKVANDTLSALDNNTEMSLSEKVTRKHNLKNRIEKLNQALQSYKFMMHLSDAMISTIHDVVAEVKSDNDMKIRFKTFNKLRAIAQTSEDELSKLKTDE